MLKGGWIIYSHYLCLKAAAFNLAVKMTFSGGTNLKSHPVEKVTKLCGSPGLMRLGPQIFVNGKKTVDYTEADEKIPKFGIIGLQIHSGKPSEAWYRNIRIRQL